MLANDLSGRGITVNAVASGPVGTDLFLHGTSSEQINQIARLVRPERLCTPDDIARVVSLLAGGRRLGQQVLRANGAFA